MKSLEDMLLGVQVDKPEPQQPTEPEQIPERIYTDPMVVGYYDLEMQNDIYHYALHGNVPIMADNLSIIDIGAGRGDVIRYLEKFGYKPGMVQYGGYESNTLLATVGNELLSKDNFNGIISNSDFMDSEIETPADIVLAIGTLNLNYGRSIKDWPYAELMIKKAISCAKEKVIFVLLHDNGGNEQYISYPIPNMTELALQFGLPFKIDYGKIDDVYTLTFDTSRRIV